ncbi:MAG TPA: transglutaminaseTgpA domain-containing protein [Ktedonobacteraceae bacterium]|nr:transglutaminaseTgpA domain-containing protein [Ktedonobacteraceae bacterium]
MRDAAIERLSKIISDAPQDSNRGRGLQSQRPPFEFHLGLAEGWFSLFLLAAVVYSTIWSVQVVRWVDHLDILSLTTAIGLVCGVVAAKQQRLSRVLVHLIAVVLCLLLAFWQTAGAFYNGSTAALAHGMQHWFAVAVSGGTIDDDSIFLFLIIAVGFLLAYMSAWLLYRTRSPWLMIVANAVVLLINLSNVDSGYLVFLVVFLIAALLLLLRFNLYESVRRWKKQGLRYSDDLGWDVMQAGALISIGILIFSWLLPAGYTDVNASQIWRLDSNPWVQLENTWTRLISVNGTSSPLNHGNFRDTLVLSGNPNLTHDKVLTVQTDNNEGLYLAFLNYDTYTKRGWTISQTDTLPVKTNQAVPPAAALTHQVKQVINIVNPPGEQSPYLLGASDITAVNMPASVLLSRANGNQVAWLSQNGELAIGTHYTVTSAVSAADVTTLRSVPMPQNAPQYQGSFDGPLPPTYFDPGVLQMYRQLPPDLDPAIAALAQQITAHAPTMYDKVVALESYLHTNYTYSVNVQLPPGEEGVSWFLFRSGNRAYCTYFASAMAVMARSLGIPARVVSGYTNGTFDAKSHQWVIYGDDAHSWTQIYFAGYGWINFEPSNGFSTFTRPLPNQFGAGGSGSTGSDTTNNAANPGHGKNILANELDQPTSSGGDTVLTPEQSQALLRQRISTGLGGLILLLLFACILFAIWWNRLFRRHPLAAQLYGRVCVLASWAGIRLQPSQTPYEYIQAVAEAAPDEAVTLERLGDIYVRDRWADPAGKEHPRRSGEIDQLPGMWKQLQPRLFFYLLRHPNFLFRLPSHAWHSLQGGWKSHRARRISEEEW